MLLNSRQVFAARQELTNLKAMKRQNLRMVNSYKVKDAGFLDSLDAQIESIARDIEEYELLTRTEFKNVETLVLVKNLPLCLIRGRAALGWSAEKFTEKTSLQNVERYEKSAYAAIRLDKVTEVADRLAEALIAHNARIASRTRE